jgi:hypothetical protein
MNLFWQIKGAELIRIFESKNSDVLIAGFLHVNHDYLSELSLM